MNKLISTELRPDCGAVFRDKYPAEDDVVGWLKIYSDDFLFGNVASKAVAVIEDLQDKVAEYQEKTRIDEIDDLIRRLREPWMKAGYKPKEMEEAATMIEKILKSS